MSPPRPCEACGSTEVDAGRSLSTRASDGATFVYTACAQCGLMTMDPFPDTKQIAGFYTNTYYGLGETKFAFGLDHVRACFLRKRAAGVQRELAGETGSILDVGCGDGRYLGYMGRKGYEIYGTELSGVAHDRASRLPGINLQEGSLTDGSFDADQFDAITLWHVLEHLPDPSDVIQRCHRFLKPNGVLVVEVPNVDSHHSRRFAEHAFQLDPPRHLYQFTPAALTTMLERAHFRIVRKETLSFEMGIVGAVQGWLNTFIAPRDLLYDMLRTRNRCPGRGLDKCISVVLGALAVPVAFLYTVLESMAGRGDVLRFVCRKN